MSQKNILNILAGAGKIAKKSVKLVSDNGKEFLEEHILKSNYVSREEYEILNKQVSELRIRIESLENHLKK